MDNNELTAEYYRAVDQYITMLFNLNHARDQLAALQRDKNTSSDRLQAQERRVNQLRRMVLASQNVVAYKEEALAQYWLTDPDCSPN